MKRGKISKKEEMRLVQKAVEHEVRLIKEGKVRTHTLEELMKKYKIK